MDHYLKPEKDEKVNTIYRIVPVERCVKCTLKKVEMVCAERTASMSARIPLNIAAGLFIMN